MLGRFRLARGDGAEVRISSKRGQALLAYLALNRDRPQSREKVTTLLWPDRGEEQARHSLRQELLNIRKALGEGSPAVVAGDSGLAIDSGAVDVDVWEFERAAKDGGVEALAKAAALYAGELMDGLDVGGADAFRDWRDVEVARIQDMAFGVLEGLAEAYAESGEADAAIEVARQLATRDPLREDAHRLLMELYAGAGRRADALRQFRTCKDILRRELDLEPDAATRRLYDDIRRQDDGAGGSAPDLGKRERTPLPLPSKPSIAVLPFDNLSGDIEQEYFADAIAEEVIATLGRFRWCFVIARNSSFAYKDVKADTKQIARELGVRYVLEGSVRKLDQRVRVNVELSDALRGRHIWAERFDRELGDIFTMQDEISEAVIASISPQFLSAEAERARRKDPASMDAWDLCIRARWHLWQFNQKDTAEARRLHELALELDPDLASSLADMASLYVIDGLFGWNRPTAESVALARRPADRALLCDEHDAWTHAVVGLVDGFMGRKEESINRLERAVDINPNLAAAYGFLGWARNFVGDTERAVRETETAIRLSPRDPFMVLWHSALSGAAFISGCYEDAAHWARLAIEDRRDFPSGHRLLGASLGQMGDEKGARAAVEDVLRLIPDQTIRNLQTQIPYREPDMARFLEGLRCGGLPE